MKVRDMLEAAGDHQLSEFKWGDDVIGLLHTQTDLVEVSTANTGRELILLLEKHSDNYRNLLDAYIELEAANDDQIVDSSNDKIQVIYKGKTFVISSSVVGVATALIALADVIRFGEIPTGKTLMDIVGFIGGLL